MHTHTHTRSDNPDSPMSPPDCSSVRARVQCGFRTLMVTSSSPMAVTTLTGGSARGCGRARACCVCVCACVRVCQGLDGGGNRLCPLLFYRPEPHPSDTIPPQSPYMQQTSDIHLPPSVPPVAPPAPAAPLRAGRPSGQRRRGRASPPRRDKSSFVFMWGKGEKR